MRFAFLVAWSHLKGRSRTTGVSAIGLVSVIGVTVGVTALIMVLAVGGIGVASGAFAPRTGSGVRSRR